MPANCPIRDDIIVSIYNIDLQRKKKLTNTTSAKIEEKSWQSFNVV